MTVLGLLFYCLSQNGDPLRPFVLVFLGGIITFFHSGRFLYLLSHPGCQRKSKDNIELLVLVLF